MSAVFLASRLQVAVQAVEGDVELAVLEPRVLDRAPVGVPRVFAGLGRLLEPVERGRLLQPEPSESLTERSYIAWYAANDLRCALAAKPAGGGKVRPSV